MKKSVAFGIGAALAVAVMLLIATAVDADGRRHDDGDRGPRLNFYIDMTDSFYRALKNDPSSDRTYSTDSSNENLRKIAISTRFMVETNLQLLKQQERIIQLLEDIRERGAKK